MVPSLFDRHGKRILGWNALFSGFFGATASCLAKFAFDPNSVLAGSAQHVICNMSSFVVNNTPPIITTSSVVDVKYCYWVAFILSRGSCLLCMILCNGYMLGTFLKGMEESGSVAGTALSTASNFISSAIYGYLLWNERFTFMWWIGFAMVGTGVGLLATLDNNINEKVSKRHSKLE
jgi:drug/metabolite transporter (DMT)-like permease